MSAPRARFRKDSLECSCVGHALICPGTVEDEEAATGTNRNSGGENKKVLNLKVISQGPPFVSTGIYFRRDQGRAFIIEIRNKLIVREIHYTIIAEIARWTVCFDVRNP